MTFYKLLDFCTTLSQYNMQIHNLSASSRRTQNLPLSQGAIFLLLPLHQHYGKEPYDCKCGAEPLTSAALLPNSLSFSLFSRLSPSAHLLFSIGNLRSPQVQPPTPPPSFPGSNLKEQKPNAPSSTRASGRKRIRGIMTATIGARGQNTCVADESQLNEF